MAFPEQQIIALIGVADGGAHGLFLLVAVTGAGDAAGQQRRLNKARTIDPPTAVAAPEIGRANEQRRDLRRVGLSALDGCKMAQRNVPLRGFGEILGLCRDCDARSVAEAQQVRRFQIGVAIGMGGRHADAMRGLARGAEGALQNMPAIAIFLGLHIGPARRLMQHGHLLAEQQLPVAWPVRAAAEVGHRHRHLRGAVLGRQCRVRGETRIAHGFSKAGRAA